MEFRLLGPLEVVGDAGAVQIGRPKARALLAALLLRGRQMVPGDQLIGDLWGDDPPGNPTATLQSHVAALRRYLAPHGAVLRTMPGGYVLDVDADSLDVARFEDLVARAGRASAEGRLADADAAYAQALALWRGAALADLRGLPTIDAAAVRLDEARLQAIEHHVDVRLQRGGHHGLVPELQQLVAAHPLREQLAGQLMVALYRTGRQADALAVHTRLRRHLDEELGLRPGPHATRLQSQILRQDPALDPPAATSRTADVIGAPVLQDRMVGRDDQVAAVTAALAQYRLVTVVGLGGVGKTRLALAVATGWAAAHDHPVAFLPLAAATTGEEVLSAVVQALDADQGTRTALEALAAHLGDRPVLLVLDNLEQIPDAGAVTAGLLQTCRGARVLATTRTALRIPGERRQELGPLAVPPADTSTESLESFDAVRLFLDRAGAVGAADLPAVAQLCRLLEGLPLAIELVAARAAVIPPPDLLARLAAGLEITEADPDEAPDAARPARHRGLRATVAWSHDLLGRAGQRLFAWLGVFAGGATIDAVQAIWAASGSDAGALEILSGLVDTGLVRRAPQGGVARVQLPEPVRQLALEHLRASGEEGLVRDAHAAHYLALAQAGKPPPGFTDTRRLAQLDEDSDNLRAAMRWLLDQGPSEDAARLATGLYRWWFSTGRFAEGRRWVGALLDRGGRLAAELRAELLLCDGFLAANQAAFDVALARYRESAAAWAALGAAAGQARAAFGQGAVHLGRNQPALARPCYEDAVALSQDAGDEVMQLRALEGLGAAAEAAGDADAAHQLYGRAFEAARALGSASDIGHTAVGLALTTMSRGDHETAELLAQEAIAAGRSIQAPALVAEVLLQAGVVALERGDLPTALDRHREALALSVQAGRPTFVSDALSGVAVALVAGGDVVAAVELFAAAGALLAEVGEPPERGLHRDCYDRGLRAARQRLGEHEFAAAWARGSRVRLADVAPDRLPGIDGDGGRIDIAAGPTGVTGAA